MKTYNKPALKVSDLYNKLLARGLTVPAADKRKVFDALENTGYFRLTGYCLPFLQKNRSQKKVFKSGTTINHVLDLYHFDSGLRSLSLQVLGKIEIALGASICNTLCVEHGAHWYTNKNIFIDPQSQEKALKTVANYTDFNIALNCGTPNNPNLFLKHYYDTYNQPRLPPAWMARECVPFGFWSHTYIGLIQPEKTKISDQWTYPNRKPFQPVVFSSWLHSLTVFRNACSHHKRITRTTIPFDPKTPDNTPVAKRLNKNAPNTLRTLFVTIDVLMESISPNSDWKKELEAHFEEFSKNSTVEIGAATGFAKDWKKDDFWSSWS